MRRGCADGLIVDHAAPLVVNIWEVSIAKSKESINRREREKAKREKADAKRERRLAKTDAEAEPEAPAEVVDESAILDQLTALNAAFDAGELTFDDFDEQRTALLGKLRID